MTYNLKELFPDLAKNPVDLKTLCGITKADPIDLFLAQLNERLTKAGLAYKETWRQPGSDTSTGSVHATGEHHNPLKILIFFTLPDYYEPFATVCAYPNEDFASQGEILIQCCDEIENIAEVICQKLQSVSTPVRPNRLTASLQKLVKGFCALPLKH